MRKVPRLLTAAKRRLFTAREETWPKLPPRSGGCVWAREAAVPLWRIRGRGIVFDCDRTPGVLNGWSELQSGSPPRSGGFLGRANRGRRDFRRFAAVVCVRAKRRFHTGAPGVRNCFDFARIQVAFEWSREVAASVAAAMRGVGGGGKGRDFHRTSAVVFRRAKQRFRPGA